MSKVRQQSHILLLLLTHKLFVRERYTSVSDIADFSSHRLISFIISKVLGGLKTAVLNSIVIIIKSTVSVLIRISAFSLLAGIEVLTLEIWAD